MKYYLLFVFILISSGLISPQSIDSRFNNIGLGQGLSQTTVFAIVQDAQGFMWFGTDDGLNRYDGYSVTIFKHNNIDSNSLADNSILSLLSDKKGDLWIGTRSGGVDRYVPSKNIFYHYRHIENDTLTINNNSIYTIYEDINGNIWIGTNKGLNRFNREKNTFNSFVLNKAETSKQNLLIRTICEDNDQNLWVGTSNGVYKMDLTVPYPIMGKKPSLLAGTYIHNLFVDNAGNVWIGTYGNGLYKYDKSLDILNKPLPNSHPGAGNFISSVFEDSKRNLWIATYDSGLSVLNTEAKSYMQLIQEPVNTLFQDNSNILWIGTFTDGVKLYDPRIERFNHYYAKSTKTDNKSKNLITSIMETQDGKLWVGTYDSGLDIYSPPEVSEWNHRKKIATYRYNSDSPNSISSDRIVALCESADGFVWVGTENDGLNCFTKRSGQIIRFKNDPKNTNSISTNRIVNLFYDNQKRLLWIGQLNGSIDSFNRSTNKFTHYHLNTTVTAIYKDKKGVLWAGTFSGNLYRFFPQYDKFEKLELPLSNINKLKNGIYSIYEDNSGILWLGTHGSGLFRFDLKNNSIKNFTENNGLPNNIIYGILPDKTGNLWLSTNQGLSKFNPGKVSFKNYDAGDGLQSNEFNQGAYFASKSGELFFGGVNGFNAFFSENIKENQFIPPVYITTFKVFDKILPHPYPLSNNGSSIELSYSENFFTFEFASLNYTAPEKNKYAYMLEGFDKNWHTVSSSQRYASYTNLDPGRYVLRVKGSNNDGIWNETGTSVIISIKPPFWKTWWFQGLIFLFSIIIIGAIVRYFVRKKIKERMHIMEKETALERERLRIARDMHDDLGARLTEIRFLTEMEQNNPADKNGNVLRKISDLTNDIISTFSEIVWSVNPQNDTLENLAEFIGQFAVDYLSKAQISCRLDIPSEIPDLQAPAEVRHNVFLAVKEALNNTVKYSDSQEVHIKVRITETSATVIIRDFGKGFDLADGKRFGNGLKNMKSRMEHIGGNYDIESQIGTGTTITFQFPILGEPLIAG